MRKLLAVLALSLAVSGVAYADGFKTVVGNTTQNPTWTVDVFNDSGVTIVSGQVVIWDNDDTEFDRSGYPYVTLTTTADDDWVAGVVNNGLTCADQTMCNIIVYGPAITLVADSTDAATEDTQVATSTVSGQAGDWGAGANTCSLGLLMEARSVDTGVDDLSDGSRRWVFVKPGCED